MPTAEYRALVAKVDAFTAERVEPVQGPFLRCGAGCDACCRTGRTAFAVEVEALRRHLATLPAQTRLALAARAASAEVSGGERCVFLDPDGRCAVYVARPLLCRTHGPAVHQGAEGLAWCDLNFTEVPAASVAGLIGTDAVLGLEHLNRLLALINQAFMAAHPGHALRAPLAAALETELP